MPLSLWQINTFEKTEKQPLRHEIMTRLIEIIHRACNELFHIGTIFFLSARRRKPESTYGEEAHTCESAGCNYQWCPIWLSCSKLERESMYFLIWVNRHFK